jgi:hypothetical protein
MPWGECRRTIRTRNHYRSRRSGAKRAKIGCDFVAKKLEDARDIDHKRDTGRHAKEELSHAPDNELNE